MYVKHKKHEWPMLKHCGGTFEMVTSHQIRIATEERDHDGHNEYYSAIRLIYCYERYAHLATGMKRGAIVAGIRKCAFDARYSIDFGSLMTGN